MYPWLVHVTPKLPTTVVFVLISLSYKDWMHTHQYRMVRSTHHQKRVRHLWDKARESQKDKWRCWLNVIFYEIQPFQVETLWDQSKDLLSTFHNLFHQCIQPLISQGPRIIFRFLRNRTRGQYLCLLGLYGYWKTVVFVHNWLEAGPFFIILTLLLLIFTIGLGDNDSRDHNMSAYSVFNRGMQGILGAMDADQLVQQHVGGGIGFMGARMAAAGEREVQDPRRQEVQVPHENDGNQGGDRPAPRRSNKKQRNRKNRNAEMRQEMQRQREAARAMGFGQEGEEGDWMAIHRLVEQGVEDEVE